jgi:hypothetical protein
MFRVRESELQEIDDVVLLLAGLRVTRLKFDTFLIIVDRKMRNKSNRMIFSNSKFRSLSRISVCYDYMCGMKVVQ